MTPTKAPIRLGAQLTHPAGTGTVSVTHIRAGVYRLRTANHTGFELADWCYSYGDEQTARDEARRVVHAFDTHGTADRIEARRVQLTFEVRDLMRLRNPDHRLTAVEDEADSIATPSDAANRRALVADLTHRYAA